MCSDSAAFPSRSGKAGAPEVEITDEMVEAGAEALLMDYAFSDSCLVFARHYARVVLEAAFSEAYLESRVGQRKALQEL